jgi:hypothetical protein
MKHKSILEQALLQIQTLEEAVQHNAKGIAMYTVKQELGNVLKESEKEEELEQSPELEDETQNDVDSVDDNSIEELPDDSVETPEEDPTNDFTDDTENLEDLENNDLEDDTLDMTDAPDSEVLKVFKSMGPNDGVVVKKENDSIELNDGEDSYIIKLNEEFDDDLADFSPHDVDDDELDEFDHFIKNLKPSPKPSFTDKSNDIENEVDSESDEMDSEVDVNPETSDEDIYEIELDDETFSGLDDDSSEPIEGEFSEAARTKWNPHGNKNGSKKSGIPSKKIFKAGSEINEEVLKLRSQNEDLKKALRLFKGKLNEIAVFNANLAYSTQLFTEHTTTKQEKLKILKKFDSVSTLNESKKLFSTIKEELNARKPITESLVEKIETTITSSSSKDILAESKAYVNPQFVRIKDLMSKIK